MGLTMATSADSSSGAVCSARSRSCGAASKKSRTRGNCCSRDCTEVSTPTSDVKAPQNTTRQRNPRRAAYVPHARRFTPAPRDCQMTSSGSDARTATTL